MSIISSIINIFGTPLTKELFFSKAGGISVFLVAFVVILYVIKNILMELTDKSNHRKGNLLLWLRKTHFGIGWIILILAIIHSVYYFLSFINYKNFIFNYGIYSGIITLIVLLLSCGFGLKYQYINNKSTKQWHVNSALLLGILIIIHLNSI